MSITPAGAGRNRRQVSARRLQLPKGLRDDCVHPAANPIVGVLLGKLFEFAGDSLVDCEDPLWID
jgi:hypothetical protein